jgi:hypothetical protein
MTELISKIGGTILVVGMILAVRKSETYLAKSLRDSRDSHEIVKDEPNSSEKPNNLSEIPTGLERSSE